jgi:hypothetical protein
MLVQLESADAYQTPKPENNLFSIDSGNGSNIFQKHYFDMNSDHLQGKLKPMYMQERIDQVVTETLTLEPTKSKSDL